MHIKIDCGKVCYMSVNQIKYYDSLTHNRDLLSKAMPILDKVVRTMGAAELGPFSFDFDPYPRGAAVDFLTIESTLLLTYLMH